MHAARPPCTNAHSAPRRLPRRRLQQKARWNPSRDQLHLRRPYGDCPPHCGLPRRAWRVRQPHSSRGVRARSYQVDSGLPPHGRPQGPPRARPRRACSLCDDALTKMHARSAWRTFTRRTWCGRCLAARNTCSTRDAFSVGSRRMTGARFAMTRCRRIRSSSEWQSATRRRDRRPHLHVRPRTEYALTIRNALRVASLSHPRRQVALSRSRCATFAVRPARTLSVRIASTNQDRYLADEEDRGLTPTSSMTRSGWTWTSNTSREGVAHQTRNFAWCFASFVSLTGDANWPLFFFSVLPPSQ